MQEVKSGVCVCVCVGLCVMACKWVFVNNCDVLTVLCVCDISVGVYMCTVLNYII